MKTRRFNLLSAMLLLGVLCLGFASCGKDDDGEDDPQGDGSGWVDDDDKPGGGSTGGNDGGLTGYWEYTSAGGDKTERIRFTGDGQISYAGFIDTERTGSYVVWAKGSYEVTGEGRLVAEYNDVYVYSSWGENSYGGFSDGETTVKRYDMTSSGTGAEQRLVLTDDDGNSLTLTKEDPRSLAGMLPGGWYHVGQMAGTDELMSFTEDGKVTYELYGDYPGVMIKAEGTYTVADDLTITVDYDDVYVYTEDGKVRYNGFTDGVRRSMVYDLLCLHDLTRDDVIILGDDDGNIYEMEQYAVEGQTSAVSGEIIGTWTTSVWSDSGGKTNINVCFERGGRGTYTTVYHDRHGDETGRDEQRFSYTYGVLDGMNWGSVENGILEITGQGGDSCLIEGRWLVDITNMGGSISMYKIGDDEAWIFDRE